MASGFSKDLVNDNDPSLDDNILDLLTEDDSPILSLSPGPSLPPPPPPQQQLQQRQQQPVSQFHGGKNIYLFTEFFFVKSGKRGKMISRGFFLCFIATTTTSTLYATPLKNSVVIIIVNHDNCQFQVA